MDVGPLLREHVEPVLASMGFSCLPSLDLNYWTYAGPYFHLIFAYDRRGELLMDINAPDGGRSVSLGDFLPSDDKNSHLANCIMMSADQERSIGALGKLAALLSAHREQLMSRDDLALPTLREKQRHMAEERWRKDRLKAALTKAVGLWKTEQYEEFVAVLAPFETDLSPATLAKLKYARRHLMAGRP